jgi:hypothetical protein
MNTKTNGLIVAAVVVVAGGAFLLSKHEAPSATSGGANQETQAQPGKTSFETESAEALPPGAKGPEPVQAPADAVAKANAESGSVKYEKAESTVTVNGGAAQELRVAGETHLLRRYVTSDGVITMSPMSKEDSSLKEDLVLGRITKEIQGEKPIFICPGKTQDGKTYSYLSGLKDCGIEGYKAQSRFSLEPGLKSMIYKPLASCVTPKGNRYATLSGQCEHADDKVVELLGYIMAAKVEKL